MRNILPLFLIFYFLSLLQSSFLVHFTLFDRVPNLILLLVILFNFFKFPFFLKLKKTNVVRGQMGFTSAKHLWRLTSKGVKDYNLGIISAFFGGFFWDIFSNKFIGFHIFILVGIIIFIKIVLGKYIRPFAY